MDYGRIAFNAYVKSKNGRTHDDKPIPIWDDLPLDVQTAWSDAAEAVSQVFMEELELGC